MKELHFKYLDFIIVSKQTVYIKSIGTIIILLVYEFFIKLERVAYTPK